MRRLRSYRTAFGLPRLHAPTLRNPSWQAWAFIAIMVVALGMRMWDLGGRTLHYDEILHSYYSWLFSEGNGYNHTPLTHGPFLFHGAAATFWLFGSSDVTARLLPALFGTALVGIPYFLRKPLGIYGALAVAVLLTVSPTILYFARFIRNDVFMAVWALALVAILWHYLDRPRTGLLVGWTVVWALAYTTKESVFLLAGSFGLFLIFLSAPALWAWVRGRARLADLPPAGDLLIVLGTLSLPLWAPLLGLIQRPLGITLVNPDANDPAVKSGEIVRAAVETGAPAGGGVFIAVFVVIVLTTLSIVIGLLWDRRRWPWMAAIFIAITLPLFTSVFANGQGFFTGYWGSLGYWLAQQDVQRASQPWYYYLIGLTTYEFLVLIPAIAGSVYLAVKGTLFDRALVAWVVLTLLLFSFAGERMPWLLVGITLPMALVAGRTIGALAEAVIGARFGPAAYLAGLGVMFLVPFALLQMIRSDDLGSDAWFWSAIGGLVGVLAGSIYLTVHLRLNPAVAAVAGALGVLTKPRIAALFAAAALGGLTVLFVFTLFVSGRASYSYAGFERPQELLVYSQTGQETTYTAECINRIAHDSDLGRENLRVFTGESDNFAWQWRWYLRDYDNLSFGFLNDNPLQEPPDVDVVLLSKAVEPANRDMLEAGFTRVGEINHLWWFPNTAYAGLTPGSVLSDATERAPWQNVTDYFFDRSYGGRMYQSSGAVWVANDLAPLATDCTTLRATSPTAS
jgi:predicted membrane-bound mannosyltransferase